MGRIRRCDPARRCLLRRTGRRSCRHGYVERSLRIGSDEDVRQPRARLATEVLSPEQSSTTEADKPAPFEIAAKRSRLEPKPSSDFKISQRLRRRENLLRS